MTNGESSEGGVRRNAIKWDAVTPSKVQSAGETLLRNLAVINISGLSFEAYESIFDGPSAFERILTWAAGLPEVAGCVFLASPEDPLPPDTRPFDASSGASRPSLESAAGEKSPALPRLVLIKDPWTEEALVEALGEIAASPVADAEGSLFYVWGDAPLMDRAVSEELYKIHFRYDAEYTFADGYPVGLTPEIMAVSMPKRLFPLAAGRDTPVARNSLFEILRKDINAFDVETHLSPVDLRMDRVSLTCDCRRNRIIAERLYAAGGTDAESLCKVIPEHRELLRSLPAYFPIQITDHSPQCCIYSPHTILMDGDPTKGRTHMDPVRFHKLCRQITDWVEDAVLSIFLWGEAASHPDIEGIIRSALDANPKHLLIETCGIGWNRGFLETLASEIEAGKLLWIITLDATDPELYATLRGEGRQEAEDTARLLVSLFGRHCWVQATRMNENEEHLDDFWKIWTDQGAQVIIQKYNDAAGFLPNRQPADLSPLKRFPCWHIKRDMPILLDGTVPVTINDLGRRPPLGNVFEAPLPEIWEAGDAIHRAHVAEDYPELDLKSDEYYTFNF